MDLATLALKMPIMGKNLCKKTGFQFQGFSISNFALLERDDHPSDQPANWCVRWPSKYPDNIDTISDLPQQKKAKHISLHEL